MIAISTILRQFFGQNRGKILSNLNSETICGIMKENLKVYFLTFHRIFEILSLVREPKKQFLWEKNDIVLLFTSHGTGLAPKTWKKLSLVKNKTP